MLPFTLQACMSTFIQNDNPCIHIAFYPHIHSHVDIYICSTILHSSTFYAYTFVAPFMNVVHFAHAHPHCHLYLHIHIAFYPHIHSHINIYICSTILRSSTFYAYIFMAPFMNVVHFTHAHTHCHLHPCIHVIYQHIHLHYHLHLHMHIRISNKCRRKNYQKILLISNLIIIFRSSFTKNVQFIPRKLYFIISSQQLQIFPKK